MKNKLSFIIGIILASVSVSSLTSCQKDSKWPNFGKEIRFTVNSGNAVTKAAYSGEIGGGKERIDWQAGDLIRIYCEQASEPDDKFADYKVSSVETPVEGSAISTAHIEGTGGVGLRWGEGDHVFYSAFPSPVTGGVTKTIIGKDVTASLAATQAVTAVRNSGFVYTADPDLKNMLMTAKTICPEENLSDGEMVSLSFTPLTTAVQFTITNQSKEDLNLKSVSLTSASSALNGDFTVDIDDLSHQPESVNLGNTTISYSATYPYCQLSGSVTEVRKTVAINFSETVSLVYDEDIAKCGSLTFTFFLQPCQNFNDLTFKLTKSDNSWLSTRLGYTDGTGIIFPMFKKSSVTGILVPEGAQWTVKYGSAGADAVTTVISWDTGVTDELDLENPYGARVY